MSKKEWPPYAEQSKMYFAYLGETPVKIPGKGGCEFLCEPGVVMKFPEEIGLKLIDRKGFDNCTKQEDVEKKPKSKKKKVELEIEKPEAEDEIKEEDD